MCCKGTESIVSEKILGGENMELSRCLNLLILSAGMVLIGCVEEPAPNLPVCGDGVLEEPNEQCDDGNEEDGDDCTARCQLATCGDGIVNLNAEACDDTNRIDTDNCTNECQLAVCGDGIVHEGVEECDDGNEDNSDDCTTECTRSRCGDGYVQGSESCDDGNGLNNDNCLSDCTEARCGDGMINVGVELCDDGNMVDDDSCRNDCIPGSCGDGVLQGGEQCDDGNDDDTDACLTNCFSAACGDGIVQADAEACDDGNGLNTDACLNDCSASACGDGYVQLGVEPCDDGNQNDADSCRNTCEQATCGDGVVWAGIEECDDGNTIDGDGCSLCALPRCGDGILDPDEQCDDRNSNNADACLNDCTFNTCGDGYPLLGIEACDDGNLNDNDGCTQACECTFGFERPAANATECLSVCRDVDCSGLGTCQVDEANRPYCACEFGYQSTASSPTTCVDVCEGVVCSQRGECVVSDDNQGVCACQPGFSSPEDDPTRCDYLCANVDCGGFGNCSISSENTAICECQQGYQPADGNPTQCVSVCKDVTCSGHGTCTFGESNVAACICNTGYRAEGLDCILDPPTLAIRLLEMGSGDVVTADGITSNRRLRIELTTVNPARRDELTFDDNQLSIVSDLGVARAGERIPDGDASDGFIEYVAVQPGRLKLTASATWNFNGQSLNLERELLVDLITVASGADPFVTKEYRLNALDAVRIDRGQPINEMNIEYIPIRFADAGPIQINMVPLYQDLMDNFDGDVRLGELSWRSSRVSIVDFENDLNELTASADGSANASVILDVESDRLYFIGVSYYPACADGTLNLDRFVGLDEPLCQSGANAYMDRNRLNYRYQVAITGPGKVQRLNVGEVQVGSLDDTDLLFPYFPNNYLDGYLAELVEDTAYELSLATTRSGPDVFPVAGLHRTQPGTQRFAIAYYGFRRAEDSENLSFPFISAIVNPGESARYQLSIYNNNRINDPGLGLGYTLSLKRAEFNLEVGRPLNVLLDGAARLRSAWDDPQDRRPVAILALPKNLSGWYQLSLQPAGFPVIAAKIGRNDAARDERITSYPNVTAAQIRQTNPADNVPSFAFNFTEGIQYSIGLTVPQNVVGGPVLLRLESCADVEDGCDVCAGVTCDNHGTCEVNEDGDPACNCENGYGNNNEGLERCLPVGLNCGDYLRCLQSCEDNSCQTECDSEVSREGRELYNQILVCINVNGCGDDGTCQQQRCGTQINACLDHQL